MNLLEIRDTLISHWSQNYNTTPTLYENTNLPDELKTNPFVVFEIEVTGGKTVGTGEAIGTTTRYSGFIAVTVNTPINKGNRVAYEVASEAISILERKRIGGVMTYAGRLDTTDYNQEHFATVVIVPFKTSVG